MKRTIPLSTLAAVYIRPQSTGTISLLLDESTFSFTNDILGDKQDRWRTTSAELTIGNFSIGSYVDTNYGKAESNRASGQLLTEDKNKLNTYDNKTKWLKGEAYYSPIWVGYKNNGLVNRVGFSHPQVQNATQNFVHGIIHTPKYNDYSTFSTGGYSYVGTINPYTLWMY